MSKIIPTCIVLNDLLQVLGHAAGRHQDDPKIAVARPMMKATSVHFLAERAAASASLYLPLKYNTSTFAAYTIPAIPKGAQQHIVTKMDCHSQLFGFSGGMSSTEYSGRGGGGGDVIMYSVNCPYRET